MKLKVIKSEGLAHNSYFLADEREATVIDPRRDCLIYTKLAQQECAKITFILETHRNEDYVTGSLELQNMTDAEICHSKELAFKYGEHNLDDGETLRIGNLKIKALYTPGHTNESLCYVVFQSENSIPIFAFTGDTLFVGSVGRTDLMGKHNQSEQAEKLHRSIHEKLLPLGENVVVYPAHGAGSICGNGIGDQDFSTIGYERKTNVFLQLGKDAFVKRAIDEEMLLPPYFKKMEEYNLSGPPLLSKSPIPSALEISDFENKMNEPNTVIVDTRMPYAFAGSFIPSSLSIWLGGTTVYTGWLLGYDQQILFVHERKEDMARVASHFWRLGFDRMQGFLCEGMNEWQEKGKPLGQIGTLSVSSLRRKLTENELLVLDVREPNEWKDGYIEGAEKIFFGHLINKGSGISTEKSLAVICSVGKRASIGASILKRQGFNDVFNVLGGMTAWESLGYPTKKN